MKNGEMRDAARRVSGKGVRTGNDTDGNQADGGRINNGVSARGNHVDRNAEFHQIKMAVVKYMWPRVKFINSTDELVWGGASVVFSY